MTEAVASREKSASFDLARKPRSPMSDAFTILLQNKVAVGSGIFLSENPLERAKAIVAGVTYWDDPKKLADASTGLGRAMRGIEMTALTEAERMAKRGW